MNTVVLSGRLTKDVELRYTNSQKAFALFTIAVRRDNGRDEVDFINCSAWDKTAENLNKYCSKGSMILVDGRLQVEQYERDGHKRTDVKVVAYKIEFLDKKEVKQEKSFVPTEEPAPFFDDGDQEDLPF